jgi:hypothetical protein
MDIATATTEKLQEYANNSGVTLRVDRDKNTVFGVKILGLESKNGRTYRQDALAKAIPLYEGAAVFLNHVQSGEVRKYQDRDGHLVNVRSAPDGLYADHVYNPKNAITEQYLWDAEHSPTDVGFSHDVQARVSRDKGGRVVVEEISRVESVDLVARPATTRGLYESDQTNLNNGNTKETVSMAPDLKDLTLDQLKESRADLVAVLQGTDATSKLQTELKAVREELAVVKAKEAAAAVAAAIAGELKAARLDAANKTVVSDAFMEQLQAAPDATSRKRLIEDRLALVKLAVVRPSPVASAPFAPISEVVESATTVSRTVEQTLASIRA